MKGLTRVVLGSVATGLLGAASFFAVDGLTPKSAVAQYGNPGLPGYLQDTNPGLPGYVQDSNPGLPGYVQDSNPGLPGYVQESNPGLPGYVQDSNPGLPGYVQDKGVLGFLRSHCLCSHRIRVQLSWM